jgi:hypothetical protein
MRAMKCRTSALLLALPLTLLPSTVRAADVEPPRVEHPGVVHQDDNCSSCHRDKIRGKSVHSAMQVSCTVCHLAQTQGDLTMLTLSMPKAKICSACHEAGALPRPCFADAKRACLECHDVHSSKRRMLLRPASHAR